VVGGLTDIPGYTHYNSRGDVVSKTDDTGATTYQARYEAFGTRTSEQGNTQDRQKANTKDEDPTGLLNEGFRYRDLESGAFITRDPLGFVDGPNMYAYVVQNPWTKFDPEGLATKEQYQKEIDKAKKSNAKILTRKAEINKAVSDRGGERTAAENSEVNSLHRKYIKNELTIVAGQFGIAHLEASAKAIAIVTGQDVASVEKNLDDKSELFRDGLTLARTGRAAELAASYYGGRLVGWAGGKLIGRIIGSSKLMQEGEALAVSKMSQNGIKQAEASFSVDAKIIKQMESRGWDTTLIDDAIAHPNRVAPAINKATGGEATAYFTAEDAYVVRDNVTKKIIQISDRFDPEWVPDSTIGSKK
jgi:RHS repeat-associated protein